MKVYFCKRCGRKSPDYFIIMEEVDLVVCPVCENTDVREMEVGKLGLNNWTGVGRLTKDVELRFSQAGKAVASFTLVIDRPFKNAQGEKEADFINVVSFGQQAEAISNYLSKGKKAGVTGRLQTRTYEDNNGQRRWVSEIIASEVEFLSPKDNQTIDHGVPDDDGLPF